MLGDKKRRLREINNKMDALLDRIEDHDGRAQSYDAAGSKKKAEYHSNEASRLTRVDLKRLQKERDEI